MNVNGPGVTPERKTPVPTARETTAPKEGGVSVPQPKNALTMDDFFLLMAVQLQNQDMTNPMSNAEMMDQLVQMATIEAMASMTTQVANSYAAGLLGQQVDVIYVDGKVQVHDAGVITGINMSSYPPTVYLDDKKAGYPMSAIAFIGQNKLEDEEPGEGEEPGEPEGPGEGEEPGGPEGPGEGEEPGEPEGPGEGEEPGEPEGPGDTEKPEKPDEPEKLLAARGYGVTMGLEAAIRSGSVRQSSEVKGPGTVRQSGTVTGPGAVRKSGTAEGPGTVRQSGTAMGPGAARESTYQFSDWNR